MGTDTTTTMIEVGSSLHLLVWLSPGFPVGAFAYSHGLEWAIDSGDISTAADLSPWLDDLVAHGAIRADCVILAAAWRARAPADLLALNDLALALSPSSERRLETAAQGNAFLLAIADAWLAPAITRLADALGGDDIAYPVIVGATAAAHGVALQATIQAYALATLGNLVSAAVRLGPIGQSEAQRLLARALPAIEALARWAIKAGLDDLGTCAFRSDLASMRHETQYSRIFRS